MARAANLAGSFGHVPHPPRGDFGEVRGSQAKMEAMRTELAMLGFQLRQLELILTSGLHVAAPEVIIAALGVAHGSAVTVMQRGVVGDDGVGANHRCCELKFALARNVLPRAAGEVIDEGSRAAVVMALATATGARGAGEGRPISTRRRPLSEPGGGPAYPVFMV